MKKVVLVALMLLSVCSYAAYNIGDTVLEADNLSWTDNYGYSSTIFNEISTQNKVVVLFWGQFG